MRPNLYHLIINKIKQTYFSTLRYQYIHQIKELLNNLENSNGQISIISSNCFAGRMMQDLKIPYNSPTLGLYFWASDFNMFLKNLPLYLSSKITFVEHSKYKLGDERRSKWPHWYPIGHLGTEDPVEIHFLHYHTEQEAAEKWYRRAKRVNIENLLVIGMDMNLCTIDDIIEFDNIPIKNKIYFSRHDLSISSNEYLPEFKTACEVGGPYMYTSIYYKHLLKHFISNK